MHFECGDVVLVPFPFTSQTVLKKRPAIVVSSRAYNAARLDVVVMAVTSQIRASAASDEVWVQKLQDLLNRPLSNLSSRLSSNPSLSVVLVHSTRPTGRRYATPLCAFWDDD
jgi:mRNA-degrading endonuclease toxin of MazEF toxin-antitoxin module